MSGIVTTKQDAFINAEALKDVPIYVFGIGSIGSNLIKQLALVGFKNITAYDYDVVEEDNIGSQEFDISHIGMKKTEAIQKLMFERYEFEVDVIDGKIDEYTVIPIEENGIYFCAFDSLEARRMLWEKLKHFPIMWGDSRIGRQYQRYYFVDLVNKDDKWIKEYESTLSTDAPEIELGCGEKGCYPSNAELVGKIVHQIVNITENKEYAKLMVSEWGQVPSIFVVVEQE